MKRILYVLAAAMLAVIGFGPISAQAAMTGTGGIDTTTYRDGATYHHVFTISDFTCNENAGTFYGTINFTFSGPSGSGSGLLTPAANGGGSYSFSGANGGYGYSYGGTYDASGAWTSAYALDTNGDDYNFGTTSLPGYEGSVTGSFTGSIPDCQAPAPVVDEANHGQCVVAAVRAGNKGTALTYYSKNASWVGATCSGNL